MRLDPGARLGSYEIVSSLGVGGMGEVYRAKDLELGREAAIKVLRKELASQPDALKRFEREARTASALNHPNIITIYHIGEHKGARYIAMELVEGQTLRALLSESPLSVKKTLDLATQIARGLAKAHAAGIVHRDLKPENLMVTDDGLVIILDFGLAKLIPQGSEVDAEMATMTKATQAGTLLGTVQYMSPEQAASRPVDYRSDQFSFGSILYEMATGKLSFKRETMPQTLAAIIDDEPEPIRRLNETIPGELTAIVERCLAKKPDERYESTRDLADDLKNVPETSSAADVGPTSPTRIDSIAVLPLRNLSGDPDQEYLADGITEALIINLAKIGALKVISRTSVMRYKGTDKPLSKIGRELNVEGIVEGSAARFGVRVRVTAQLIHAPTDRHLWAESYERDFQDVLLLQSEVAQAIAGEIKVAVTPEEGARLARARRVNPEAYEAYLKGRFHWYKLTPAALDTALQYFELALEKDPNYALAQVGIGFFWAGRAAVGPEPPREALPKWKAAAMKAVELDDTLAETHTLLAIFKWYVERDWPAAEREFRRAVELNPNSADTHQWYSIFLASMSRPQEARAQMERALELDPHNAFFQWVFDFELLLQRHYEEAIAQIRESLPDFVVAHWGLWVAFHAKGMYEEALVEAKASLTFFAPGVPEAAEALERGYAQGGYAGAMRRAAEMLAEHFNRIYVKPLWIAELYACAGERDRALDWLEKAYEDHTIEMVFLSNWPAWDSVRDDPRFQDLLRRMNLPL